MQIKSAGALDQNDPVANKPKYLRRDHAQTTSQSAMAFRAEMILL
jgi:hypothetical protein